jgi:hypothetical protein
VLSGEISRDDQGWSSRGQTEESVMAKGPERVEKMVKVLRQWQGIERQAMEDMNQIIEESKNPLVRMIMEIIRHDSLMHHRVQQFMIDSLTDEALAVTREDVATIWEKIEKHDAVEKHTIKLAEECRKDAWSPIHKQLFDYLLGDEKKHDSLIDQLRTVKTGMSQASGG